MKIGIYFNGRKFPCERDSTEIGSKIRGFYELLLVRNIRYTMLLIFLPFSRLSTRFVFVQTVKEIVKKFNRFSVGISGSSRECYKRYYKHVQLIPFCFIAWEDKIRFYWIQNCTKCTRTCKTKNFMKIKIFSK